MSYGHTTSPITASVPMEDPAAAGRWASGRYAGSMAPSAAPHQPRRRPLTITVHFVSGLGGEQPLGVSMRLPVPAAGDSRPTIRDVAREALTRFACMPGGSSASSSALSIPVVKTTDGAALFFND